MINPKEYYFNQLQVDTPVLERQVQEALASGGSYWSRHIANCAVYTTQYLPDGTWTVPAEL